jgi:hypothetical protein
MKITQKHKLVREDASSYDCQETLAAGIARGRQEEHQSICRVMRRLLAEIVDARFPLIADFIKERIKLVDNFSVLYQFLFIMSTAWAPEDVLRFILALDDAQEYVR